MAKHPNQGGGNNRQGPKVRKGASERGPITDSWNVSGGKPMKGRNMAGHNWTRPRPASHKALSGGNAFGSKKSPPVHDPHPR